MNYLFVAIVALMTSGKLVAQEETLDLKLLQTVMTGKVGDTIKIPLEAVNNTQQSKTITRIVRTGYGVRINGVVIKQAGKISISSLYGTGPKGVNPQAPITIAPKGKQKLYVKWVINGETSLTLSFGKSYKSVEHKVDIKVTK